MKIRYLIIFLISISVLSCKDDEEINPAIETLEVKAESPVNYIAKGNIKLTGNIAVLDYGFIISGSEIIATMPENRHSLGNDVKKGEFTSKISYINGSFSVQDKLYVRAYITNEKGTVYGNAVSVDVPIMKLEFISPQIGKKGDRITISGKNFSLIKEENKVTFGNTPAMVVESSNTAIVVEVPGGISPSYNDMVSINVEVGGQRLSSPATFTVLPSINSFLPTSGAVGTVLTFSGDNFRGELYNTRIVFAGIEVSPKTMSMNSITAEVPANIGTETFSISIRYRGNDIQAPGTFTIKPPAITSFLPASGIPGSTFYINGSNFSTNTSGSSVYLGQTKVFITQSSNSVLTADIPTNIAAGKYKVKIVSNLHTTESSAEFEVLAPKITSISPLSGGPGTKIDIMGENFISPSFSSSKNTVFFGDVEVTANYVYSNKLTVTIPSGLTPGLHTVSVLSGINKTIATQQFDYKGVSITSFEPASATPGTLITIRGTGFSQDKYYNQVKFGTTSATIISASNTSLVVSVPTMLAGNMKISVTANGEIAVSGSDFNLLP